MTPALRVMTNQNHNRIRPGSFRFTGQEVSHVLR